MSTDTSTTHVYPPGQHQNERKGPRRHAAPSAPWPWIDIHDDVDSVQLDSELPPVPELCNHRSCGPCWNGYPKSRFPNWTKDQVVRSKISDAIGNDRNKDSCIIYRAEVHSSGIFKNVESINATNDKKDTTWKTIIDNTESPDIRVRALFIENLSGPVLQMLGARYNIEPFFFSSSLNWIPSRFQEDFQAHKGDHITVTLTYLKSMEYNSSYQHRGLGPPFDGLKGTPGVQSHKKQMIDTQTPLRLNSSHRQLVLDLLSVHLIRHIDGSTIISFHPETDGKTTSAKYLHKRIRFAGRSVYWQNIFKEVPDPTFVLLTFVWHAMYAWDEALDHLQAHIGQLEATVLSTSSLEATQELHNIRAHQLYYASLLEDFRKTVKFIRDTRNPAIDSDGIPAATRARNAELMERECSNLMDEIDRLDLSRKMLDKQLRNVMNLVFNVINIDDSRRMGKMTETAVKDSAGLSAHMKQIAFLTMIYLPASFIAAVFGMNVQEIVPFTHGTLGHYVETAVAFTSATVYIIVAFQSKYIFGEDLGFWERLGWPYMLYKFYHERNKMESSVV